MQARTIIAATFVALFSFACASETASNFFKLGADVLSDRAAELRDGRQGAEGRQLAQRAGLLPPHPHDLRLLALGDAVGARPGRLAVRHGEVHRGDRRLQGIHQGAPGQRARAGRLRRVPHRPVVLQGDPDRLLHHAAVVREGSGAGDRRPARAVGVRRSVRRQHLRARGAQAHRRVRQEADRARALRGPLLPRRRQAASRRSAGSRASSRSIRRRSASRKSCCCWAKPT